MANNRGIPTNIRTKYKTAKSFRIDSGGNLMADFSDGQSEKVGRVTGTTIISSSSLPDDETGLNGDLWLYTPKTYLFGPKANDKWPTMPVHLAGVGVQSAAIDDAGHLIVALTEGEPIDLGKVVGAPGKDAVQPTFTIGTITEGSAGASLTGTKTDPKLNLTIPKGSTGASPVFQSVNVTTGAPGTSAAGSLAGTATQPILNLTIPKGIAGDNGISIIWKGTFTAAPLNPLINWAYYNSALRTSFVYDGTTWQVLAKDGAASFLLASGVANGPAALMVAGGTISIVVTLSQNMGGTDYQATASLYAVASVSILGTLVMQGITTKTATSVTVSIKSTALISLDVSALRVEVIAMKAVAP